MDELRRLRELTQQLNRTETYLDLVLKQFPGTLWVVDKDLRFTLSVGMALEGMGLQAGQVVGKTLQEYFGSEDRSEIAEHKLALQGQSRSFYSFWGERVYLTNLEPLRNGTISGVVGVATDITNSFHTSTILQRLAQAAIESAPEKTAEILGRTLRSSGIEIYENGERIAEWGRMGSTAATLTVSGKTLILHDTPSLLPYAQSVIAHLLGETHAGHHPPC